MLHLRKGVGSKPVSAIAVVLWKGKIYRRSILIDLFENNYRQITENCGNTSHFDKSILSDYVNAMKDYIRLIDITNKPLS